MLSFNDWLRLHYGEETILVDNPQPEDVAAYASYRETFNA